MTKVALQGVGKSLLNKHCWVNWIVTWKQMKFDPYPHTTYKYQLQGTVDLNVKGKTMKLVE